MDIIIGLAIVAACSAVMFGCLWIVAKFIGSMGTDRRFPLLFGVMSKLFSGKR